MSEDLLFVFYIVFLLSMGKLMQKAHNLLLPSVDTSSLKENVACIANFLGIEINPDLPLPTVNVLGEEELAPINPDWDYFNYEVLGIYYHRWLRILLNPASRQDIFYHELSHYVQYAYNRVPKDEKTKENEAWACTHHLMTVYHPFRYQVLKMVGCGYIGSGLFEIR